MSRNKVHGHERIKFVAVTAHTAGDLVWQDGFYGVVQDDVAAGGLAAMILVDTWVLTRAPSTLARGTVVAAPATEQATSLPLLAYGAHPSIPGVATAGWQAIGRTVATGTATTAKVMLFGNRPVAGG